MLENITSNDILNINEVLKYLNGVKITGTCDNPSCKKEAVKYIGVAGNHKSCGNLHCTKTVQDIMNNEKTEEPLK